MKLSDYVIDSLVSEGVTHIFEVCGGALSHLLDSIYDRQDISAVSMHHEMAAAIAAEGYARVSGNIGVAMATSGPGATNLITGIGSCYFDSIPCLFITGQVNTYEYKFNKPVRQIGFQETDIVNIVKPIVKKASLVDDEKKIKYLFEGIYTAKNGRPGPVLLDLPLNIQRAQINSKLVEAHVHPLHEYNIEKSTMEKIVKLLNLSVRPVVLVGGGVRLSNASEELLKFINNTNIPVLTSLMGLDSFPHDHESFIGMIGTYGNRYANLTLANADLILAMGTRLDTRQTGTVPDSFARNATIVHVDIDKKELNNKVNVDYPLHSDVKNFLVELNNYMDSYYHSPLISWKKEINSFKKRYPSYKKENNNHIKPNYFMHELSRFLPEDTVVCVDVGQNQIWAAQSLELKKSHRFLTQGGMASIGSALPLGVGAAFAKPDSMVVVITGDGGFQLNIQELQTVYHHKLPVKIILLNNHCYGMIKQFQEQYFNSRFQSTVGDYSCPDFQEVVSAYKIPVMNVNESSRLNESFKKLFKDKNPMFLEVSIDPDEKALPKLSVDRPIEDQEPLLSLDELKFNMSIEVLGRNNENERCK